ncbi:MAG: response regulator [Candidatus Brocadiaceae bacterium]
MRGESDIFDARDAAAYLKLNEQTVRRLAREKQIPAFKVGGTWRFKKSVLDSWAEAQQDADRARDILVVDDEEPVRDFVRRVLEREGHSVTTASDGAEALELMQDHNPDCVLLDLRMPGMGGPETLKRIREGWGALPVVILTGYPEIALMHRALQYAPITLLAKPVTRDQIVEAVENLLGERGP